LTSPVASPVQRGDGRVEGDGHLIVADMYIDQQIRRLLVDGRTLLCKPAEEVGNGILNHQGYIPRMVEMR